jgi:hypothetical protein
MRETVWARNVVIRTSFVGVIVVLVATAMTVNLAPIWVRIIVAVVLGAILVKAEIGWLTPPPAPEPVFIEPVAPPAQRTEEPVVDILLPSKREDYGFLFSATVIWLPIHPAEEEPTLSMAALAADAVLKRAREITENRDPTQVSLVRHELAGTLAEMREDSTGRLWARADSVGLCLPDQDQHRLDKLAAVRKEKAIWEHERKYEQSKREYLGEDVLKDPGSAVVWWLAKNDEQVEKTVQDIGLLAQLSSAAKNIEVPETFQQLVAGLAPAYAPGPADPNFNGSGSSGPEVNGKSATDHLDAFLVTIGMPDGDPKRLLFARQVANLATAYGRRDIADELKHRFDVPNDDEYPPDPDDEAEAFGEA